MSVYKDNATGKWRVIYRYTDITGKRKQTQKRGFETKREAVAWEHEMMLKSQAKLDMTFGSFYEIYEADKASRLKQSTWETKSHIIRTKILPYFADRKIDEIEVRDVIAWQNELLAAFKDEGKEERYSQDYLRTIQAQLTAIFAHAVKYYNLPKNPSSLAGTIGKEVPKEMQFWTKEEYLKFAEEMMDKPRSYYAFELLYWTGMDCQHFFRQIFLGYFPDIVQAFDTLGRNVYGDDYTSLHNPIVLSSVLLVYGMFHSTQILF